MNICLINPPYKCDEPEDNEYSISGYTVPHLGLGYIASLLRKKGYKVDLIECMGQNITVKEVYEKIKNNNYTMIGFSTYDDNRLISFKMIKKIRKIKPNSFIFMGGYTATLSYQSVLINFKEINCCVLGEGEITTLELAQAISNSESYKDTDGIAYVENNNVVKTSPRKLIKNLDILPYPERAFVSNKVISMITSRGCQGHCIYCSIITFYTYCKGKKHRYRSAENIVDEIEFLLNKYDNIKSIWFFDDNFLKYDKNNINRLNKFCDLMGDKKINIPFYITSCPKDINYSVDILKKLKNVGLYKVFVGVESFCQRQLDFFNKNVDYQENIQALQTLKELNLEVNIGFIPLDPFVTIDEIKFNFNILKKYNIRNNSWSPFSVHMQLVAVKNTPFYRLLKNKGLYVNNEKGYIFVNEDVNFFYESIQLWLNILSPMLNISYYVNIANEKQNTTLYKKMKKKYDELIELDIDFILSFCDFINENKNSLTQFENFIKIWEKKYKNIFKQYKLLIKKLN
ncbi:B12-binding domain-containing radical SAM protein [Natronospora cellulosivora (SeqCode)]